MRVPRFSTYPVLGLALLVWAFTAVIPAGSASAQQLPPGMTWEQISQLPPDVRQELLRRLQLSMSTGSTPSTLQQSEVLIPAPDTTLGISSVDTTHFYVEDLYDFGLVPGEFDSLNVLEVFGRRLFARNPSVAGPAGFEPGSFGPVGSDYSLGPGDQVIITIWGFYQELHTLTINREGYVLIPEVGQVPLATLNIEQAKQRLYQVLTPSHLALDYGRNGATAFLDISLGRLRSIKVFVLGEVQHPQSYTVSSLATVFTSLYAAGGPNQSGSLRDIRLIRGSEEISRLDAYDYLLRGDASKDKRLEDGDIVFVSTLGPQAIIQGRVRRPAVYEIRPGQTVRDLIALSGGVTAAARLDRVQIARILPPRERGVNPWVRAFIDVDLRVQVREGSPGVELVDGDVVTVFPIPEDQRDFVVVEGAVWNPGRLQWSAGMTIREAIERSGGLRGEAMMSFVEVIRTRQDEQTQQLSRVLQGVMDGNPEDDLTLERRDKIRVFALQEIYQRPKVFIYGQVEKQGEYLLHQNMTVNDLIVRAGGLRRDAWSQWVTVVRLLPSVAGQPTASESIQVRVDSTYSPNGAGAFELLDFDQVFVRQKPKWEAQRNAFIHGEVLFPGLYALERNDQRVSDLVARAGGLTPIAHPEAARFYRRSENAGRVVFDLVGALEDPASIDNIIMQAGDSLFVPTQVEYVTVRGAVGQPTNVLHVMGKGPRYYISQAGGFTESSDPGRMRVTQPNGTVWRPRWWFIPDPDIEAGSLIFVPERAQPRKDAWEIIRDTTAILSGLTTALLLIWQISR